MWATGVNGSALSFDGINDYVFVPNNPTLNPEKAISFEAWAKAGEHKTAKVVEKGDWDGHGITLDKWRGWQGGVYIDGDKRHKINWGERQPALDQWYHIVLTYDGSELKLYVNGAEKSSESVSGSLKVNSRYLCIGSNAGKQKFFDGIIDAVSVYDRALSAEEVKEHYEDYKPVVAEATKGGLWLFDEGSGITVTDSSGNGNKGKIIGATWTTGLNKSALSFDGIDAYVDIPNSKTLDITGDKLTVEAWIKWNEDPGKWADKGTKYRWANIIDKNGDHQYQMQHSMRNEHFEFAVDTVKGRTWVQSTTTPQKGIWYYVVGVYNGSAISSYVNGEFEASKYRKGDLKSSDIGVNIGRRTSGDRYFPGIVDEVAICNRALTAEEIKEHYEKYKPVEEGITEVGLWHLDEGSGTTARDSSGNENDGVLDGPVWTTGIQNYSLEFDGVDDRVQVADSKSVDITGKVTLECWVKIDSFGSCEKFVSKDTAYEILEGSSEGKLRFALRNPGILGISWWDILETDRAVLGLDRWHYVTATYDGSHMKLFVDGEEVASRGRSGVIANSEDPLAMGAHATKNQEYFDGVLDEVTIYDRALSADEIMEHFEELRPTPTPTPSPIPTPTPTITPTPTPVETYFDLAITDIYIDGSTVYYKIQNIGSETIESSCSYLYVDDVPVAKDLVGIMAAGQTNTEWFNYVWECSGTEDNVTVVADGGNSINETDETNNGRTEIFTAAVTGQPDLVIADIYVDGNTIYYRIQNIGTEAVELSNTYLYINGEFITVDKVGKMAPGQMNTEGFDYTWDSEKEGDTITVTVVADGDSLVDEVKEDNNKRAETFSREKPAEGNVDLTVLDIFMSGNEINYLIKNLGTERIESSTSFLYINDVLVGQDPVGVMAGGQTNTEGFEYIWQSLKPGDKVTVVVDGSDQISESDELNNEKTVVV